MNLSLGTKIKFTGYASMDFYGTIIEDEGVKLIKWDDNKGCTPLSSVSTSYISIIEEKSSEIVKEKKCYHCGKLNDLNVKNCWWCSAKDPTGDDK